MFGSGSILHMQCCFTSAEMLCLNTSCSLLLKHYCFLGQQTKYYQRGGFYIVLFISCGVFFVESTDSLQMCCIVKDHCQSCCATVRFYENQLIWDIRKASVSHIARVVSVRSYKTLKHSRQELRT